MKVSAGLLLFRRLPQLEVLVAHPGGPYWAGKDAGAWSLPKGLVEPGEDPLATALREFVEETGQALPEGQPLELGAVKLKSGKRVLGWALEGDCDPAALVSNTFELEWPPRSGRRQAFPEIDRLLWASPELAAEKLNPAQVPFVERLVAALVRARCARRAQPGERGL